MSANSKAPLAGRIAIVTGAASGIGAATARLLSEQGAAVCCADVDTDGAAAVAASIADRGGDAFARGVDVRSPEDNEALVEAVLERHGALHIAHLNAGVALTASIADLTPDEWDRVISTNLTSVFLGIRSCAPAIAAAGGGSIIATSSLAGFLAAASISAYVASKHGVLGLVKCAAVEFARQNIRVNAVCPGAIDTPILGPAHGDAEFLARHVAPGHPIGRVGQADEVAQVVAFLAGDGSSFMTGAGVAVDGGASAAVGFEELVEAQAN